MNTTSNFLSPDSLRAVKIGRWKFICRNACLQNENHEKNYQLFHGKHGHV